MVAFSMFFYPNKILILAISIENWDLSCQLIGIEIIIYIIIWHTTRNYPIEIIKELDLLKS